MHTAASALGQFEEILGIVGGALAPEQQGSPGAGPSGAGPPGAPGPIAATTTTVSPTFQQAFTPQISPVFTQVQSSPGTITAATPVQTAPGGQRAAGGGTVAPALPGIPQIPADVVGASGLPLNPLQAREFTDEFTWPVPDVPSAAEEIERIRASAPFKWTPVLWGIGIVGAIGVVMTIWGPRGGRRRKGAA